MLKLKEILPQEEVISIVGNDNPSISGLIIDSRNAGPKNVFFAIRGTASDGHLYIENAIQMGASVVVCETLPSILHESITYVQVKDSSIAVGLMSSNFYQNPSKKLTLVGVTGTNGKTTTVTLLYRLTNALGFKSGLLSTVTNFVGSRAIPSTHTTPDAIQLNELLAIMVSEGCTHCFMEVSSHAIVQNRISGLEFKGGVFTNITHDHLDFHKTFDEYIKAKKQFFDKLPAEAFALTNVDDRNGQVMVQNTKAQVSTYSLRAMANYRCKIVDHQLYGMLLNIDATEMWSRLIGQFNAYNILAVYATAILLKFEKHEVLTAISGMEPVNGRFEHLRAPNGVVAIVDYAHTPDAVENVIDTINELLKNSEKLITVIGAGGNRDKTKRPIMARVAANGSSLVILTSDNPRFENPEEIIAEMKVGVEPSLIGKVLSITDRREAIRTACLLAGPGDIVLVAGKGHENYQEIKGIKHHFDDKEEIANIFKTLQP
jgi:UDP-N-acetylmuramoyl-L-alanyl-D-glutamate--2,6-diaminopimelate ligase